MPTLPSGRRVEFSLDRFHALLGRLDLEHAFTTADALQDPDDLLMVMDAVDFDTGKARFAGWLAADWAAHTARWAPADREALRRWLTSASARDHRAEAIHTVKALLVELATDRLSLSAAA